MEFLAPPANTNKKAEPGSPGIFSSSSAGIESEGTSIANEAKIEKSRQELKLKRKMKRKLKMANLEEFEFDDFQGNPTKFSELYDYIGPLGAGGFSFVVHAVDKATGA